MTNESLTRYGNVVRAVLHVIGELEDFHGVLNDCQRRMAVKLAECIPLDELKLFSLTTRELPFFLEYFRVSCSLKKLQLNLYDESLDIKAIARALHTNCVLTHRKSVELCSW